MSKEAKTFRPIQNFGKVKFLHQRSGGWGEFVKNLSLVWAYFGFNFKGGYAFRTSFWLQVWSMVFNDLIWVAFWVIYFARFPMVHGWQRRDILFLWGVSALAFGLMDVVFGNALRLGRIISEGELDIYLSNPKPPLFHSLISRQNVVGWGDLVFGLGVLFWSMPKDIVHGLETLAAVGAATLLLIGFVVMSQSLVFFIGGREGLGNQLAEAFLVFSHYPSAIFHGWMIRIIIFGVMPAGLINALPLAVVNAVHPWLLWVSLAAGILEVLLARLVFYRGLQVYTSGNRITIRT